MVCKWSKSSPFQGTGFPDGNLHALLLFTAIARANRSVFDLQPKSSYTFLAFVRIQIIQQDEMPAGRKSGQSTRKVQAHVDREAERAEVRGLANE